MPLFSVAEGRLQVGTLVGQASRVCVKSLVARFPGQGEYKSILVTSDKRAQDWFAHIDV